MSPSRTSPALGARPWSLEVAGASGTAPSPAAPFVIVGLGNEIASDDGVGLRAADALATEFSDRDDVEVVSLPWAGFALLDVLRDRKRAVLIDSLATGARPPGTVVRLGEGDFSGSVRLNSFHDINYPTAMALGRSMGWEMPEEVAIWGVETATTDEFGEELTPEVAHAVGVVTNQVAAFINGTDAAIDERPGVP
jgi:hydrogenase maturation protease